MFYCLGRSRLEYVSRVTTLGILADRLRNMERTRRLPDGQERLVGTGHAAIDSVLPGGGLCRGTLVDWINNDGPGSGAGTLALLAAGGVMRDERGAGTLAVVDRGGGFYAVAAASLGVPLEQVLVVRPMSEVEWMWAVEQVLRSPAVDVVLTWAGTVDERVSRRWQLAVEHGGGVGMLVRTGDVTRDASWSAVRVLVRGCVVDDVPEKDAKCKGRRWGIRVLRGGVGRGPGRAGDDEREVLLELNDETGGLCLLPGMERSAPVDVPTEK